MLDPGVPLVDVSLLPDVPEELGEVVEPEVPDEPVPDEPIPDELVEPVPDDPVPVLPEADEESVVEPVAADDGPGVGLVVDDELLVDPGEVVVPDDGLGVVVVDEFTVFLSHAVSPIAATTAKGIINAFMSAPVGVLKTQKWIPRRKPSVR